MSTEKKLRLISNEFKQFNHILWRRMEFELSYSIKSQNDFFLRVKLPNDDPHTINSTYSDVFAVLHDNENILEQVCHEGEIYFSFYYDTKMIDSFTLTEVLEQSWHGDHNILSFSLTSSVFDEFQKLGISRSSINFSAEMPDLVIFSLKGHSVNEQLTNNLVQILRDKFSDTIEFGLFNERDKIQVICMLKYLDGEDQIKVIRV